MKIFDSYCDFHIGDNLMFLHYLRRLAVMPQFNDCRFVHAVHQCHIPQLLESVEDIANIELVPYEQRVDGAFNSWKQDRNFWASHPLRNDYTAFYLDYFARVPSVYYGVKSPFSKREDFLFDYPSILKTNALTGAHYDILFINSQPCSGQFMQYDSPNCMDWMIHQIKDAGRSIIVTKPTEVKDVPCTQDWNLTVTQIGNLSLTVDYVIGICTGPIWATFNVWNQDSVKKRLILQEHERLNLGKNMVSVTSFPGVMQALKLDGIL